MHSTSVISIQMSFTPKPLLQLFQLPRGPFAQYLYTNQKITACECPEGLQVMMLHGVQLDTIPKAGDLSSLDAYSKEETQLLTTALRKLESHTPLQHEVGLCEHPFPCVLVS